MTESGSLTCHCNYSECRITLEERDTHTDNLKGPERVSGSFLLQLHYSHVKGERVRKIEGRERGTYRKRGKGRGREREGVGSGSTLLMLTDKGL